MLHARRRCCVALGCDLRVAMSLQVNTDEEMLRDIIQPDIAVRSTLEHPPAALCRNAASRVAMSLQVRYFPDRWFPPMEKQLHAPY